MPVKIPDALPAARVLAEENIFVMTEKRAVTQDIRPLRIAIVNLMPTKIATETQLTWASFIKTISCFKMSGRSSHWSGL